MTSISSHLVSGSATQDPAIVWIPQTEYDGLVRIAHQYANLCQNLIGGGVTQATIDLLSNNVSPASQAQTSQTNEDLAVRAPSHTAPVEMTNSYRRESSNGAAASQPHYTSHNNHRTSGPYNGHAQSSDDWAESPSEDTSLSMEIPGNVIEETGNPANGNGNGSTRPHFERAAVRSIQLSNLADEITHGDIAASVRGGAVLDIYLRRKDGSASVSFVHAHEAQAFYDHVRRNDLYIKNKRVEIKWSDRQYVLPGHLAQKIGSGATRNFVIRRCDPNHTEASIREDLEHIHNLTVVKMTFLGGDCYISTNSVANAVFARTCMTSRLKYKGSRIEWDVDECAQSLDRMPINHRRRSAAPVPPRQQPINPMANRFELLNLDD
ncbi:Negative regulator of differentiation 1-like protein [Cladobotryum mycophilum]|uniref:Negative regulator of differentiation 1-like protein n=1 Tax=Cladobotryum mycophilum TaxID=491253 RepID=A0ABR0S9G9_9HYPO